MMLTFRNETRGRGKRSVGGGYEANPRHVKFRLLVGRAFRHIRGACLGHSWRTQGRDPNSKNRYEPSQLRESSAASNETAQGAMRVKSTEDRSELRAAPPKKGE